MSPPKAKTKSKPLHERTLKSKVYSILADCGLAHAGLALSLLGDRRHAPLRFSCQPGFHCACNWMDNSGSRSPFARETEIRHN